jgi:hypothetical protein
LNLFIFSSSKMINIYHVPSPCQILKLNLIASWWRNKMSASTYLFKAKKTKLLISSYTMSTVLHDLQLVLIQFNKNFLHNYLFGQRKLLECTFSNRSKKFNLHCSGVHITSQSWEHFLATKKTGNPNSLRKRSTWS